MKRLLTLLLALILLACAANAEGGVAFPLVGEGESATLTIAIPLDTAVTPSAADLWLFKYLEEKSGVDLEFTQIDNTIRDERLNLMYASGDLPDILMFCNLTNLQILQYGMGSKLFAPLNDLISEYAPNVQALFEAVPSAKAQCTAPDGNIYALCGWSNELDNQNYPSLRAWINQKWLDDLDIPRPETLDELYEALVAFRDDDPNGNGLPDEIPVCDTADKIGIMIWLAYGVVLDNSDSLKPALKDGQIVIPAATEYYRAYLETMHKWYSEGLIDPDCYIITTAQMQAKNTEGRVGAHVQAAPHTMMSEGWEDYEVWPALTSEYSDTPVWPEYNRFYSGRFVISNASEHKELAMRLIDWFYTEQGALYCHYGPIEGGEDETYGVHGWYFDESGNGPLHHRDENDGYSSDLYYRNSNIGIGQGAGLIGPFRAILELYGIEAAGRTGAAGHWRRSMSQYVSQYYAPTFPSLFLSEADGTTISELYTPLSDYRAQMEAKFVTGILSLDEFDAYIAHLNTLGLKEYIAIYEDAFDVYLAGIE